MNPVHTRIISDTKIFHCTHPNPKLGAVSAKEVVVRYEHKVSNMPVIFYLISVPKVRCFLI